MFLHITSSLKNRKLTMRKIKTLHEKRTNIELKFHALRIGFGRPAAQAFGRTSTGRYLRGGTLSADRHEILARDRQIATLEWSRFDVHQAQWKRSFVDPFVDQVN